MGRQNGYRIPTLDELLFLAPVPCVPPEYQLMYDPTDMARDRPLRFYRYRDGKKWVCELTPSKSDVQLTKRKSGRSPRAQPQLRWHIFVSYKNKTICFQCNRLTLFVKTGWCPPPEECHTTVCLHLNEDSLDDRPSNLRWGTQQENVMMSAKSRAAARRNIKKAREAYMQKARERRAAKLLDKENMGRPSGSKL